ncbi:tRNA (adenosine(37)-N6)-threonylcarbamoyltransferase complex dimerization subunit type 1 TsaB [bacterium]|nr:tRNA (adenosine(37)-N6)-threonylcarbamoyltransferase complex dimerization subunit type 1 TsaB [bacterium]RQV93664.1 MAG: tRNA (adenosine(37)-N6)-threonylcarbamoyltransferase complex dimerization subunit type 1 TsaB [bacterium]
MIVLGIETATSLCGIGLSGDEGPIADYKLLRGTIHGEYLPIAIEHIIEGAGITISAIEGIAVSIGPGSFTGLRIGLGMAKGLAFGLSKPLIAVPTMDGLISPIPGMCEWACVLLIARKGEVYQGIYQWTNGCWERKDEYKIILDKKIGDDLPKADVLFLGEGSLQHQHDIQKRVKGAMFLAPVHSLPSGYNIAEKGRQWLINGETADIDTLVPIYVKRFQGIA